MPCFINTEFLLIAWSSNKIFILWRQWPSQGTKVLPVGPVMSSLTVQVTVDTICEVSVRSQLFFQIISLSSYAYTGTEVTSSGHIVQPHLNTTFLKRFNQFFLNLLCFVLLLDELRRHIQREREAREKAERQSATLQRGKGTIFFLVCQVYILS